MVKFPIAGEISYSSIGNRLNELNFNKPWIVCLQINFVDNMQLLNEIIINLCLFRVLKSHSNLYIIPETWTFYIELTNTFDNSIENKIIYKRYVREYMIQEFNIRDLTIPNKVIKNSNADCILFTCKSLSMKQDRSIIT